MRDAEYDLKVSGFLCASLWDTVRMTSAAASVQAFAGDDVPGGGGEGQHVVNLTTPGESSPAHGKFLIDRLHLRLLGLPRTEELLVADSLLIALEIDNQPGLIITGDRAVGAGYRPRFPTYVNEPGDYGVTLSCWGGDGRAITARISLDVRFLRAESRL